MLIYDHTVYNDMLKGAIRIFGISSYTYAGAQVLSQRQYPVLTDPNFYDSQFYVHDRVWAVCGWWSITNDVDDYVSVANMECLEHLDLFYAVRKASSHVRPFGA